MNIFFRLMATSVLIGTSIVCGSNKSVLLKSKNLKIEKYKVVTNFGQPEVVKPEKYIKLIPDGYELKNVPGDGLCGYWSILMTQKVLDQPNQSTIYVKRSEILKLLKQIADDIAYVRGKKEKTEEDLLALEEIESLVKNDGHKDFETFLNRLERGSVELDSPITFFVAKRLGVDIHVKREVHEKGNLRVLRHIYRSNAPDGGAIQIYYSGNGAGGHYQGIIPKGKCIHFE